MNILIVKMSALGDVVMTLPTLAALRQCYPNASIDWLVEGPASSLLIGHPQINRALISPRKQFSKLIKSGNILQAARRLKDFLQELRAVEYDIIIDLQGLLKSAFWVWLSKGKRKIGFAGSREKTAVFLNEKIPPFDPDRHAALRYMDAAVYLGATMPHPLPEQYYTPPRDAIKEAASMSGETSDYIVLNPGAKWETKRWPLEHWQSLAKLLAAQGCRLVITGAPEDAPQCEAIANAAPQAALNLCAQTTLPQLAAIMQKAAFVVTADTGPMHLAAATGAKGLALFGPTRPNRTGPFGGHFKTITPPRPCLGCLKRICDIPCLATLTPETVLAAVNGG